MNLASNFSSLNLNLSVETVLQNWPQTAAVFLKYRMSCPGCYLQAFDTLGDVLTSYSIPAEAFLSELDEVING